MTQTTTTKYRSVYCVPCGKKVRAMLVGGCQIYPYYPEAWDKQFYMCPECKNYVGVHRDTGTPLGTIPTPEVRQKRQEIHAILDPLWQWRRLPNGFRAKAPFRRKELYRLISERLGRSYHTAKVNSVKEAEQVLSILREITQGVK